MRAVDGVSLTLEKGEVLGVVGESGSGKSVTMLALMGLVPFPGRVTRRQAVASTAAICSRMSDRERRKLTGKDVAMIFQEPTTSLNPCFTIGFQLTETLRLHEHMDRQGAPSAAPSSCSSRSASRRRRAACQRLPAPALRRHEPARHDRHGDRLQSQACSSPTSRRRRST